MYAREFHRAHQTRRFEITRVDDSGWEIRDEQDNRVLRHVRYSDWHRVERAKMAFARQAVDLEDAGWREVWQP